MSITINKENQVNEEPSGAKITAVVVGGIIAFIGLCFVLWLAIALIGPQLRLYRANTEKQAAVAEARARADAAVYLKDAEVTRAEGVAEANEIIAESITDEYVRWLYVDQLDQVQGQIIYIPTEGGIPILEANRLATEAVEE
jgi:hypothetical protein